MTADKLKDCPFCGCTKIDIEPDIAVGISCSNEECGFFNYFEGGKDVAIKAWNLRAEPASDKPWCCWINQETGEECKNPARWDIRWPPFGYEDNTQSCDDHIFNLRGEGRNEITKIPEPVAPIRTEIQKMVDDMVNTPKGPRYVQRNIGDLMILEDMDKPVAAPDMVMVPRDLEDWSQQAIQSALDAYEEDQYRAPSQKHRAMSKAIRAALAAAGKA